MSINDLPNRRFPARHTSICQKLTQVGSHEESPTMLCTRPKGHLGKCGPFVEAMGVCGENDDCRARRAPEAPTQHNPRPIDWSDSATDFELSVRHNH